jgi:L-amino acid N-acyltransferase YncA
MYRMTIRDTTDADLPAVVEIYNAAIPGRTATAETELVSVDNRRVWFQEHSPHHRPPWIADVAGRPRPALYPGQRS